MTQSGRNNKGGYGARQNARQRNAVLLNERQRALYEKAYYEKSEIYT